MIADRLHSRMEAKARKEAVSARVLGWAQDVVAGAVADADEEERNRRLRAIVAEASRKLIASGEAAETGAYLARLSGLAYGPVNVSPAVRHVFGEWL